MIERHKIDLTKHARVDQQNIFVEMLSKAMNGLNEGKRPNFYYVRDSGKRIAESCALHGDTELFYFGLRSYVDFGIAHFVTSGSADIMFSIEIMGNEFSVKSSPKTTGVDSFEWSNTMNAAIIIRDKDSIDKLLNIPIWGLIVLDEPFHHLFAEYQANVLQGKRNEALRLRYQLKEEAESDTGLFIGLNERKYIYIEGRSQRIKALYLPLVDLYEYAQTREAIKFNDLLEKHIVHKRQYIVDHDMEADFRYWVDFSALAVCSYAFDRGVQVNVESDYIPAWIFKGEFEQSNGQKFR